MDSRLSFDDPEAYGDELDDDAWERQELIRRPMNLKANELDFDKIFNTYMAAQKKPWVHDRDQWLGASEAFGCLRKAWYKRNKAAKDKDFTESWGATRRGDLIENFHVVPAMMYGLAELFPGTVYLYGGEDQVTLFHPEVKLSATPDGLITGLARNALAKYGIADIESDCIAFEIKSVDPRVSLVEEKSIHHGQTQVQLGLFRETTEHKPVYSVIFYVNASFMDDMKPFPVKFSEEIYASAVQRARTIDLVTDPNKILREGSVEGGCEYCPYQGVCLLATLAGVPDKKAKRKGDTTDPLLQAELDVLVKEEKRLAKLKKKSESEHGLVKEKIKLALREFNSSRAAGSGWKVSYSKSEGRETIDHEAMVADGIDIDKYKKRGNGFENLRIVADFDDE